MPTVPKQRTPWQRAQLKGRVWNRGKGKSKAKPNRKCINSCCKGKAEKILVLQSSRCRAQATGNGTLSCSEWVLLHRRPMSTTLWNINTLLWAVPAAGLYATSWAVLPTDTHFHRRASPSNTELMIDFLRCSWGHMLINLPNTVTRWAKVTLSSVFQSKNFRAPLKKFGCSRLKVKLKLEQLIWRNKKKKLRWSWKEEAWNST